MNTQIFEVPAQKTKYDLQLVLQENEYLASIEMQQYTLENDQDVAEAARDIRWRNAQFLHENALPAPPPQDGYKYVHKYVNIHTGNLEGGYYEKIK